MRSAATAPDEHFLADYGRLRTDCAILDFGRWSLVELTGDDRASWLQGQVTQDLSDLHLGGGSAFCLCRSTGQIEAVCGVWALFDRLLISCPAAALPALMSRIDQTVILEDVAATVSPLKLRSMQGPASAERLRELLVLPSLDAGIVRIEGREAYALRSDRSGSGGWDLWSEDDLPVSCTGISPYVAKTAQLEAGIPEFGRDITSKTLPPELGRQFESTHVSYQKGCYTGQEVLMRIHSRGHTNQTWMALVGSGPMDEGQKVVGPTGDVGLVTSAAFSPKFGFIAGAMVRNEAREPGGRVKVGEMEAEVREMPLFRQA